MADLLDQEWEWFWRKEGDEADCGIYAASRLGAPYAICRCPRYLTEAQWTEFATHICDLHNATIIRPECQ